MKKNLIGLVVAGLAAASVAQAAPQENTFYVGVKAGQASFHDGIKSNTDDYNANSLEFGEGYHRNSFTYGIFGGYQAFNRNNLGVAVELGYDDFGRVKYTSDHLKSFKHSNHGFHVSAKGSYEVLNGLDIYGKAGVALVRSDYKFYDENGQRVRDSGEHSLRPSGLFAVGAEYAVLPELAVRLEYQWLTRVGKLRFGDSANSSVDYNPWIGSINAGVSYRFGQGAVAAPAMAPEVVSKTFNLNSDVTFAFGKANLKPQAQATLDGIYGEIAQINSAKVAVAGYTDRIGSDAGNLKLSQRRADTVANYLVQKGVATNAISATGYGKANPVTGATCDQVKGRKALIACLAPDRRVEIAVNGTK